MTFEFFGIIICTNSPLTPFLNYNFRDDYTTTPSYMSAPFDLSHGIIHALNYLGENIDFKKTHFSFNNFTLALNCIAVVNPPDDLEFYYKNDNHRKFFKLTILKFAYNYDNYKLYDLIEPVDNVSEIKLSKETQGVEFFGICKLKKTKFNVFKPIINRKFKLNFEDDLFDFLDNSSAPYEVYSKHFKIITKPDFNINNLITEKNESIPASIYIKCNYLQTSICHLLINCSGMKSLIVSGSNDETNFEEIISHKRESKNHDSRFFFLQSTNRKYFKYFKVEFNDDICPSIRCFKLFGQFEIIQNDMKDQIALKTFEKTNINTFNYRYGILDYLDKDQYKKITEILRDTNNMTIEFTEISASILSISLIDFESIERLCIEIFDGKNWIPFFSFDKKGCLVNNDKVLIYNNDAIICFDDENNEIEFTSIRFVSNKKYNLNKIVFSGLINPLRFNPLPRDSSVLNMRTNPFNGIINSGLYAFNTIVDQNYFTIEFEESVQVCVQNIVIDFISRIPDDFIVVASNDKIKWTNLNIHTKANYLNMAQFDVNEEKFFRIFQFSLANYPLKRLEFFGEVNKDYPKNIKVSPSKLSAYDKTSFSFDKNNLFKGIFYNINNFFIDNTYAFSAESSNGSDLRPLFDHSSIKIFSFANNNDSAESSIKFSFNMAQVNLKSYLLCFDNILFQTESAYEWTLEGSNNMNDWELISEVSCEKSDDIALFDVEEECLFSYFRIHFKKPISLRKIEFYGDYIPSSTISGTAIIKYHPISLKKNQFDGIISAICQATKSNPFEKKFIRTSPIDLSKGEIMIKDQVTFDFGKAELNLSGYSIDTSMKKWNVMINSNDQLFENGQKEEWVSISSIENTKGSVQTILFDLKSPTFSKLKIVNGEKNPAQLKKIEFFGLINDKTKTKVIRYDVLNGILFDLFGRKNELVFRKEASVKSSDYKFTIPLQIFDRNYTKRLFYFYPSYKYESSPAFITLEFWSKAIKVDNYSIISLRKSSSANVKIEGSNSKSSWEKIDVLTDNQDLFYGKSKSNNYFHFIRISSTDEFSFENIEFFGDYKDELIQIDDQSISEVITDISYDEADSIADYPLNMIESSDRKVLKKGFFHTEFKNLEGFFEITSSFDYNASSLFYHSSSDLVILKDKNSFIKVDFPTVSFKLTHFYIECLSDNTMVKVIADDEVIYNGFIPNGRRNSETESAFLDDLIAIPNSKPINSITFRFIISEFEEKVQLSYFEIYGKLVEKCCPDVFPQILLGHNKVILSSSSEKEGRKVFTDGIIKRILLHPSNSDILLITETYRNSTFRNIVCPRGKYIFGNSPQRTFNFPNSRLTMESYSLSAESKSWILEGSNDNGKKWFIIDIHINESNGLFFTIKQPLPPLSSIRLTNVNSLFDGNYKTEFCGVNKIDFYGDLEVILPLKDKHNTSCISECDKNASLIYFPYSSCPEINEEIDETDEIDYEYSSDVEDINDVNENVARTENVIENVENSNRNPGLSDTLLMLLDLL